MGQPVLEKSFDGFYGHGGHLGHVTWIIYIHIDVKFGFDWPNGFRVDV